MSDGCGATPITERDYPSFLKRIVCLDYQDPSCELADMHILRNPDFYRRLIEIDRSYALMIKNKGCPKCGEDSLNFANYERKPRGTLGEVPSEFSLRFSLCCGRDGCRTRVTPRSVRFVGRKVYVSTAILFIVTKSKPILKWRLKDICKLLCVSHAAARFWISAFRESFDVRNKLARALGGIFPALPESNQMATIWKHCRVHSISRDRAMITMLSVLRSVGFLPI